MTTIKSLLASTPLIPNNRLPSFFKANLSKSRQTSLYKQSDNTLQMRSYLAKQAPERTKSTFTATPRDRSKNRFFKSDRSKPSTELAIPILDPSDPYYLPEEETTVKAKNIRKRTTRKKK